MPETPTEAHNRIATATLTTMAKAVTESGGGDAALMVVLESIVLGTLRLAEEMFGVRRSVSIERLETMTERVCERLAAQRPTNG